jgi:hypothetical protein
MESPSRWLYGRSSFAASAHPGRFGAGRFDFGRSLFSLRSERSLSISQMFDAVISCASRYVATTLGGHSGLDLHLPELGLLQRRPAEGVVLAWNWRKRRASAWFGWILLQTIGVVLHQNVF